MFFVERNLYSYLYIMSSVLFPVIETERLLLRQMHTEDAAVIYALRSSDHVNRYIDRTPMESIELAPAFITKMNTAIAKDQSMMYWMVELKYANKAIGTLCLFHWNAEEDSIEMGYEMLPQYEGQGLMNEGVRAVIDYAIGTMKAKKINAFTHPENIRSQRLLEKHEFKRNEEREKTLTKEALGNNFFYTRSV